MWGTACFVVVLLIVHALVCEASPIASENSHGQRMKRDVVRTPTLADRVNCGPGDPQPSTRVNTTERLVAIRNAMSRLNIHAFIILSEDAHSSEYPAESEKRRGFISGFTGSSGVAVVTLNKSAVWTDGRYFEEAENALDCNWIFMKQGQPNVPNTSGWLIEEMRAVSNAVIGADPFLLSNSVWQTYLDAFRKANITFQEVTENPVDTAWASAPEKQPQPPQTDINVLEMTFAGKRWQDKISDLRGEMDKKQATAFVVTSLDETAWLFNLRAKDIESNPFFLSYAIVERNRIRLYILDKERRLTMDPTDVESKTVLHVHLSTSNNGTCHADIANCVEVLDYNRTKVVDDIKALAVTSSNSKIWVTPSCNYAIYNSIPTAQRLSELSSISLEKAMKNSVEQSGMDNSHGKSSIFPSSLEPPGLLTLTMTRDSLVLIEFLAKLDKEVKEGIHWTEVSAARYLETLRLAAKYNRGLSFEAISASGPNGAVIHYRPAEVTNRNITTKEMYLLDSGGQYLDGTTDVTRTLHFGEPTEFQKISISIVLRANRLSEECYTRVLMGSIGLASLKWPAGLYAREVDLAARAPLWSVGLEYNHGTGHGIGYYLSVHEGPGSISMTKSAWHSHQELREGMFFSNEPGYYRSGEFGIRLETIVMVQRVNTTYTPARQFMGFKTFTLVPFEPNLINYDLLTQKQIDWLNSYNQRIMDTFKNMNLTDVTRKWLETHTRLYPFTTPTTPSNETLSGTTPSNETLRDTTPSNETFRDTTPSNETLRDTTPSNETFSGTSPSRTTPSNETTSSTTPSPTTLNIVPCSSAADTLHSVTPSVITTVVVVVAAVMYVGAH